jgi:hypothetical protein
MSSARLRFTTLLPLLSSVAALVLVAAPVTLTYMNLQSLAQHSDKAVIGSGNFYIEIPRNMIPRDALMFGTIRTSHIVGAIDMPGAIAMLAPKPTDIPLDAWRALVLPFSSLPFWWFAGLGFDALLRRLRLYWSTFLLGSLLMVGFLIFALGLRFGLPASDREDMAWPIYGMALWTVLFSSFPVAGVRQLTTDKNGTERGNKCVTILE